MKKETITKILLGIALLLTILSLALNEPLKKSL